MRNYIKAELYRSFNRVYFWGMTAGLAVFGLLLNCLFLYANKQWGEGFSFEGLMEMGIYGLSVPMYLIIIFVDMITSEEQKNLTLKNVVGGGLSRGKMYIGKLIASVILSFISAGIILTVFYGTGFVLFRTSEAFNGTLIQSFGLRLGAAIPLWISGIAIATFLGIAIKNNTFFAFLYAFLISFLPTVLRILGYAVSEVFTVIHRYLPTTQLGLLAQNGELTSSMLFTSVGIGVIYTLAFTVIGLIYIKRKAIS